MSKNHIKLHKPNKEVFPVRTSLCSSNDVLDFLPKLLRQSRVSLAPGFWIEFGVSFETHVFIARESRVDPNCLMDVFALEVRNGGKARLDEVFNSARSTFAHVFGAEDSRTSLTVYSYPDSCSADGESYPCGTIFTIGPTDPASDSSLDSNLMRCSPSLFETPYSANSGPNLPNPTPVENSDHHHDNCSTRKGKVEEPASLVLQDEPHKLNPFADNAGFTGTQPVFQVMTSENARMDVIGQNVKASVPGVSSPTEHVGVVMLPAEESSTSAKSSTSDGQLKHDKPKVGSGMRSSDAMVTGLIPRSEVRPAALTVVSPPRRRLSLQVSPVPEGNRVAPEGRTRTYSDLNTQAKRYPNPEEKGSPDAANPETKCYPTNCSEVNHADNSTPCPAGPAKPVFLRSISGPPVTPVLDSQRPLLSSKESPRPGVERQESGEDEIVVGAWKKVHDKKPPMSGPNIAVTVSDTTQVKEIRESLGGLNLVGSEEVPAIQVDEASECCADEAVLPVGVVTLHSEVYESGLDRLPISDGRGSEDGRSSTSGSGCSSEKLSETDLYQVHLLGHACNQRCNSKMGCRHANDPDFAEGVKQMSTLVERLIRLNESAEDLKRYIYIHCYRDCPGLGCQVPHQAAGCAPPSAPHIIPEEHSPSIHHNGLTDCSVDCVAAFDSTTPPDNGGQAQPLKDHMKLPLEGPLTRHAQNYMTPTPNRGMPYPERHFPCIGSPLLSSKGGTGSPYMEGRTEIQRRQLVNNPLCVNPQQRLLTPGPGQGACIVNAAKFPQLQGYPQPVKPTVGSDHRVYQVSTEEADKRDKTYQFQKYDPKSAARIRQLHEQGRQQLPDVSGEGFPEFRAYGGIEPWTIIYSSQDCEEVLTPGFTLPRPCMDQEKLGKGGNGKVSRHYVNRRVFAIKETNYRRGELNAWRKLSHPNLVPLLGVMLGQNNLTCYQFMPFMSENLSEVLHRAGCLEKLSKRESPEDWRLVRNNMWQHILIPVLQGLQHLESLNMQHCDVKASNILISKPDTCSCKDVLHCKCPDSTKFQVMLADYDSIRETQHHRVALNIPNLECSCKSPDQLKKVMGTIAYRAPEKFVRPCKSPPPSAEAPPHDHSSATYLEGPWCDIWSFGMVVARLAMGRDTDADKRNANILKDQPHRKDLNAGNETVHAIVKLKALYQAASYDVTLKPFADLADACLTPDFRHRLTPSQLLDIMRQQSQL